MCGGNIDLTLHFGVASPDTQLHMFTGSPAGAQGTSNRAASQSLHRTALPSSQHHQKDSTGFPTAATSHMGIDT